MKNIVYFRILSFLFIIGLCSNEEQNEVKMLFSSCQALKKQHIVEINEVDQEVLLNRATLNCFILLQSSPNASLTSCSATWDTVLCWPETSVNKSVTLPCPNYINKFNTRNRAFKHCVADANTSEPVWSLTDYSQCFEQILCNDTICRIGHHIKYIIILRIVGYVASLASLTLSIIILLRPKLRCPRNFVHINLFVAFSVRTILTMLVDTIANKNGMLNENINSTENIFPEFSFCKILVTVFFYSGSVFTVAITAEAFYLVLLLKYPFYSEKNGSIFCIILSWVLPILWFVPWVFVRAYFHNFWCWQTESKWNLIFKIPHSLLLITNIVFAISIIRVLYSKTVITQTISKDNITKYRVLAKSIFILIPVFGLHFIFFAWLPYAKTMNITISTCFEIVIFYIETFFNAFQGLAVAITCCLKYTEVRIEFTIMIFEMLKKIRCSTGCFKSDYINQLRWNNSQIGDGQKKEKKIKSKKTVNATTGVFKKSNSQETQVMLPDTNKNNNNNSNQQSINLITIENNQKVSSSSNN